MKKSSCCDARVYEEIDICRDCKEPCGTYEEEDEETNPSTTPVRPAHKEEKHETKYH